MTKIKYHHLGPIYALFSAVLFGASTPAAKYFLGEISPWLLAGLLYWGSGVGLCLVLFIRYLFNRTITRASLTARDYGWLAMATLFGGILGPVLLMLGLLQTTAASASLLLNLENVFTALIAWFIFKEHTHRRLVYGMILIVIGSIILSWQQQWPLHWHGTLFIAGACCAWAIDNNVTRNIAAADPLKIVAMKSLAAGSINIILALMLGNFLTASMSVWLICALIGFIGYGISIICFMLGLRHIGTARTSAYFSIAPFVGALLAVIFLGEHLSLQLIIAAILMALGIGLHLTEHHAHEHEHEPLYHDHTHTHDEHHQHTHSPQDSLNETHAHPHQHVAMVHSHPHFPDIHHRHKHT